MKKEEIRKEYFKLRIKGHTNNQCRIILKAKHDYEVSRRTLRRWTKKLEESNWDLRDASRRPKSIKRVITSDIENKIINLRNKTGWCAEKIENFVEIGHTSINKILQKNKLTNKNIRRKKRLKYIRWQRKHPNSLWQMDVSDQKIKDKYCFAVIDDCSRYCLGLFDLNRISTMLLLIF